MSSVFNPPVTFIWVRVSAHLVERGHPLGELRLDLRQSLRPLQRLLQLLLGFIQTLLQLPLTVLQAGGGTVGQSLEG
ncbi:hypothetical protein EYF80_017565 [Liparis tanakae]|uniref:Uncharacterized protein n=1 Tax=Liparis tanakae TaxID=230148 RepID=A0A4Z2I2C1_9TELE|nr:hypothetical protein EYF80_017565 [Liparis tanakae]